MNSDVKRKTADLLSICIKAGKTVKGFDSACTAVKDGSACCILTASDASDKTVKEVRFVCGKYGAEVLETQLTKADMRIYCGKETAVIAVCDKGFADGFARLISAAPDNSQPDRT